MSWTNWHQFFQDRAGAPTPPIDDHGLPEDAGLRRALARTFSVFQLGEAGEGRIATEVRHFQGRSVDDAWRRSIPLWVREEGRHGRILGDCARALGGKPVAENWTNSLLVFGRRLLGLRLKLLVILSAEVIGITFYGLIADALPPSRIRTALYAIVEEEEDHLAFHSRFFHLEAGSRTRRALFSLAWLAVGTAAGAVVLHDHRDTFKRLGVSRFEAAQKFSRLLRQTARAVRAGQDPMGVPPSEEAPLTPASPAKEAVWSL